MSSACLTCIQYHKNFSLIINGVQFVRMLKICSFFFLSFIWNCCCRFSLLRNFFFLVFCLFSVLDLIYVRVVEIIYVIWSAIVFVSCLLRLQYNLYRVFVVNVVACYKSYISWDVCMCMRASSV